MTYSSTPQDNKLPYGLVCSILGIVSLASVALIVSGLDAPAVAGYCAPRAWCEDHINNYDCSCWWHGDNPGGWWGWKQHQ